MKIEISRVELYKLLDNNPGLTDEIYKEIERGGLNVDYRSHPNFKGREYLFDIQSVRGESFSNNQL